MATSAAAVRHRRALVVDDDDLARLALAKILSRAGFDVVTASDGLAGLRALADQLLDLDVMVTDVRMPGLGGEELIRRIREVGGERDLGIVVVSAVLPDAQRLESAGADAILCKTDGVEAISSAVELAARRTRDRHLAAERR